MIFGVGVDLVEITRIEDSFKKFPGRFEQKIFTEAERAYCNRMPIPAQHYAARFAAKESYLKALGTGKARGIGWRDIGIENLESGQPVLVITGRAKEISDSCGIVRAHVSLSHTRGHSMAAVVLECAEGHTGIA
jgi:holo-[acyl-carrier protein] synthase